MKILIYGGGAVGLGIASCLIKSGEKVDIIARKNTVKALHHYGLIRTGIFGEYRAKQESFYAFELLSELKEPAYDYILVCTKSYDSSEAAKAISKHPQIISDHTGIVLCQNGWGNAEIFANYFPTSKLYNARIITGFSRVDMHIVEITVHVEAIHIGSLYRKNVKTYLAPLCESIAAGGIPCRYTNTIIKDLWAKMLYNCALNPLGAIFQVPYGDLGTSAYTQSIMTDIIRELYQVMGAAGYTTYWESPEAYLDIFLKKRIKTTKNTDLLVLINQFSCKNWPIDATI